MKKTEPTKLSDFANAIFDVAVEGIITIGVDGLIQHANRSAVELFRFKDVSEMIGRNSHELVHNKYPDGTPFPQSECPLNDAIKDGKGIRLDNEVLWRADGTSFFADNRITPLIVDGKVVGAVATFIDNTEKIKSNEALLANRIWLEAALRGIGDGVVATDSSQPPRITFLNPVAEKLTGWKLDEAKGQLVSKVFNIIHQETRQPAVDPIARVLREAVTVGLANHTVLVSKDGSEYVIEDSAAPIKSSDGSVIGVVLVFRDTTKEFNLKKAQAASELRAKNEIEEAAKEVNAQKAKLDALVAESTSAIGLMYGPDLIFELANKKWTELVSPREYIGRKYADVYPELVGTPAHQTLLDTFQTGVPFQVSEMKLLVTSPAGVLEDQYFDYANVRILDAEGRPYGVYCNALNVTDRVRSRLALDRTQTEIIDTLESMSDAFFAVDKDWKITQVNAHHIKSTVKTREEQIGNSLLELFFSDEIYKESKYWKAYHKVMRDRVKVVFDDYYEPLDLWTQVRAFPKSDGGMAVFFSDVSEMKRGELQLQKSEASFKAITEATPLIVWTATPDGNVDFANSKWYEFSGLTEEQTLGIGFTSIVHPDDITNTMARYQEAILNNTPLEIEHRFKRGSDSSYRWFLTRALPSLDENGQATKWFGTNVEIHEQKLVAAELIVAKGEADRANFAKSAFLANMSHEIRTPLGAILGFTDLLRERELKVDDRSQYLETISRNGKALTRIIDDILDLAKVESGKLEIEKIEFSFLELIDEIMDVFRESTKSKGIFLRANLADEVPNKIISDPTRLRQILINVVGNAVKFTETDGVTIQAKVENREDQISIIRIYVKDTGIGLSEEQQEKLFQPFMQADNSTTRKFGGTGLGLALSRRLANALGGDINIQDCSLDNGCTFIFSFLAEISKTFSAKTKEQKNPSTYPVQKSAILSGVRILLADDSPDNQNLVSLMLQKQGAIVETASNGQEALRMGMKGSYDLVLMDIQMPIMDGYESTKALREAGFKKPIIALTAHAMAEERARTKAAGCDGHLTKPIDRAELISMVEQFSKKH